MRKKSKLVLFAIFFVVIGNIYSQQDTCFLGNLQEYQIINKSLVQTLDSIIIAISSLDEFVALNRDLFITIFIEDTHSLTITATAYSCSQFNRAAILRDDKFTGYLYQQNHLVLIAMPQYDFAKLFVKKTEKYDTILFINSDNLSDHIMPPQFTYFYNIATGSTILEEGNRTEGYGCYYIYKIKQGDTWQKLAEKFHCSEKEINLDTEGREKIIVGNYICLSIACDEGKVVSVKRVL